ncbi:hypothetical protein D5086_007787, partial [Populus alba]
ELDIPVFQRLTHLELKGKCVDLSSRAPHSLLQKLPHLDCLDFRMGTCMTAMLAHPMTKLRSKSRLQIRKKPHLTQKSFGTRLLQALKRVSFEEYLSLLSSPVDS